MSDERESLHEVDEHLRTAGERWRASRTGVATSLDASLLDPSAGGSRAVTRAALSLAGLAGAVVLVALVIALLPPTEGIGVAPTDPLSPQPTQSASPATQTALPTATPDPTPTLRPTPAPTPHPMVRDGDEVVGIGYVVRFADGTTRLCGWGPVLAVPGLHCAPPSVEIVIADPEVLPGWGPYDDQGESSDWVRLDGRWTGDALHVELVGSSERVDTYPRREPPCDPPPGGWPGNPAEPDLADEQVGLRLQSEIDARPSLYSGIGITSLGKGASSDAVLVVGTVGDVDQVRRNLSRIYPYNLCVVEVDYSRAELEPLRQRLTGIGWQTYIDGIEARLVVELPVLDDEAATIVADDMEKLTIRPLVERSAHP